MKPDTINIPLSSLPLEMAFRLHITGWRRFYVRYCIGLWLMKLGARTMGCKMRIEVEDA